MGKVLLKCSDAMNNHAEFIKRGILLSIFQIFPLLIFLKGCGYREIYDISVFAFFSLLICTRNKILHAVIPVIMLILHVFLPGISLLWGYCLLMFSLDKRTLHYAALSSMLWICECFNIIPYTLSTIVILAIIFMILYYFLLRRNIKWIILACGFVAIIFTVYSMPWFASKTYVEKYVKSSFTPSEVFRKITDATYIDSSQINYNTRIIRSSPFFTKIPMSQPGIFISEVDYKGNFENMSPEVWQQPISWHDNQLIGNQYYLEGIRNDGGLYSNKGITLSGEKGSVQLAYMESFLNSRPLIVKHDQTLYLHDSDYSSSYLANYQKSFLKELVGNSNRPNYIRILNILFVLMTFSLFFIGAKNDWKINAILSIFIAFMLYLAYLSPHRGDIRLVGTITNSHENNKFDGVVKKIVEAGFDYTVGDYDTKILVVQKGKDATVKSERVVLAEEGCTIKIDGKKYTVNNNTIGNVNGIVDARQWICDGNIYDGIIKVDSITLIATGSPALQQWKDIIK